MKKRPPALPPSSKGDSDKTNPRWAPWFCGALFVGVIGLIIHCVSQNIEQDKQDKIKYAEYQKNRIVFGDYVKLTRITCNVIWKFYPKSLTLGLSESDLNLVSCGEIESGFYLRHSLIRYKREMYSVYWTWADYQWCKNGRCEAHIDKYNVPYCVIGTEKSEFAVEQECSRIP